MIEFGNPLPYDIRIGGSSNQGFIVVVGCATCIYTDKQTMLDAISEYIDDPKKVEQEYNKSRKGCHEPMPDPGRGNMLASGTGPVMRNHVHSTEAVEECMDEQPNDCGPDTRRQM